jgi:excisionase family DNA binding protein
MTQPVQLYTEAEACERLRVCRQTLLRMRKRREIRCTKLGRAVRYSATELQRVIDRKTR